jgi:DNA primase
MGFFKQKWLKKRMDTAYTLFKSPRYCARGTACRRCNNSVVIPPSFITDLLARVDVVEVVGRYVQLKKGGANFMGLCPFHNEKSPSFTVSPTKQFYHCFGCGAHGTAISFLMEYQGMSFPDAVEDLARNAGMVVPRETHINPQEAQRRKDERMALTEVLLKAAQYYKNELRGARRAVEYLKGRGLTGEIAAKFGLGYAPDDWQGLAKAFENYEARELEEAGLVIRKEEDEKRYDRFRDRIMFPIRNIKGEVIGFGGRVIDQGEPKYLNSPETPVFNKGSELYGLFEARQSIRERGYVLVTEGYMDVVALAQLGFPNAVATLGTATSGVHVQKLLRQTDHVVYSFDGDAAGRRAAWRALESALPFAADDKRISFLFLPAEHDPDSFIREQGAAAFEEQVKQALPLSAFLVKELTARNDIDSAEGRAALLAEAKPLLQQLPAGALRLQIMRLLAEATKLNPADVERFSGLNALEKRMKPGQNTFSGKRGAPFAPVRRVAPLSAARRVIDALLREPELYATVRDDLLAWKDDLDPLELAAAEDSATAALADLVAHVQHHSAVEDASFSLNSIFIAAYAQQNDLISQYLGEVLRPETEGVADAENLAAACKKLRRAQLQQIERRFAAAGDIAAMRRITQKLAALG